MNYRLVLTLAATLGLSACGDNDGDVVPDTPTSATVIAVGGDFSTAGILTTIDVPSLAVAQNAVAGVASADPVVRHFGDRLYVINRFGANNVTILDADSLTLIDQISTGDGSNPQDVAVVDGRVYVPALGTRGVVVLDESDPAAGVIHTIDLSAVDPTDDLPDCNSIAVADGALFVTCGIFDQSFVAQGPGVLAVVDPGAGADTAVVRETLDMINANPIGFIHTSPQAGAMAGDLVIATAPNFGDLTEGCVERISVTTPGTSCLATNSQLGGYASSATFAGDDQLLIAVTESFDASDFGPLGRVVSFDLAENALASDPMTPDMQRPFDLATCPTGHVAVADATTGIRVYDAGGAELTAQPLDIGLPPVSRGLTCH